jgi:hypothetical protein
MVLQSPKWQRIDLKTPARKKAPHEWPGKDSWGLAPNGISTPRG